MSIWLYNLVSALFSDAVPTSSLGLATCWPFLHGHLMSKVGRCPISCKTARKNEEGKGKHTLSDRQCPAWMVGTTSARACPARIQCVSNPVQTGDSQTPYPSIPQAASQPAAVLTPHHYPLLYTGGGLGSLPHPFTGTSSNRPSQPDARSYLSPASSTCPWLLVRQWPSPFLTPGLPARTLLVVSLAYVASFSSRTACAS